MPDFDTQKSEFEELNRLLKSYNRLCYTPIVDDDYHQIRYLYERDLQLFLIACRHNGRSI